MRIVSEAIKSGSLEVFTAFYKAEFDNLTHFVGKYVFDKYASEDIVQESFLALWNSRENIDCSKNIRSYLYTIARNRALNHLRDTASERSATLRGREAELCSRALMDSSVTERIETMETERSARNVLASLSPEFSRIFAMSREEGLSYKEISEKMNISVKSVEYRMSVVLRAMRRALLFILFLG